MPDRPHLPELARSLRALGAVHGMAGECAHAAVFGPLLDARAHAASGDWNDTLSAFRGQALGARIVARAADAARKEETDPAHGRARAARAREAVEPLRDALHVLDTLTPDAQEFSASATTAWTSQLARVFRVADDACRALTIVLGEPVEIPPPGWFGRFGR